jgi:oligopeptide/dipeptide ABC transporter ATP-binding protein
VEPLVQSRSLVKLFPIRRGIFSREIGAIRAVDGVSLSVGQGETLGLVGESGCGKTTFGRCLLRLIEPTHGEIFYEGTNILKLRKKELRRIRSKMQIVFQDPVGSLDPRQTISDILREPLHVHKTTKHENERRQVLDSMLRVGLAEEHLYRLPHEFSGGQRQRIGIARALILNPSFLVLDEPTSSLDVSVQAQILNLLKDLQREMNLTYVFISHDLSVVRYMSTRVAVMYLGKIVEVGPAIEIFNRPIHPYTKALISSLLIPNPRAKSSPIDLRGEIPSPVNPPKGCRFRSRCPAVTNECIPEEPVLSEVSQGHLVACHRKRAP